MTRNTNGQCGIASAGDRRNMQDGGWKNDTRKVKLAVNLDRTPPHLQILEDFSGGTQWVVNLASATDLEEILFEMKHGLPFKPKVLCYFKTIDTPIALAALIGQYQQTYATMLTNAFPNGEEWLEATADAENFYIKHKVSVPGFGTGAYTYYGSDYKFRVRFEILNIPDL